MSGRLASEADLAEACAALCAAEPRFAYALALTGQPPLRLRPGGFEALLRLIVEQQLSVAAAESVWRRMVEARTPRAVLALDDDALRAMGLSRPKVRYARALAEAVSCGDLDLTAIAGAGDAAAIAALTEIKGIGRWTAECYLLFCDGRPDVFPAGDLALQEGARRLFGLPARPKAAELADQASAWAPQRGAAARVLWAYVRVSEQTKGNPNAG